MDIRYHTVDKNSQEVTLMYFSFWQEHLDEFLGLLRKQGYHPKTIAAHKRFALSLVTHEDQVGWHSYEDARTYISGMERLTDKARWFKLSIQDAGEHQNMTMQRCWYAW